LFPHTGNNCELAGRVIRVGLVVESIIQSMLSRSPPRRRGASA
jgi:hypothetical protein